MRHPDTVLRYFYDLQHAGQLDAADNVFSAQHGHPDQGDVVRLYVRLEHGIISATRFECYGSVASLAASEFVCRWLMSKKPQHLGSLTAERILDELGLSTLHNHVAWRLIECIKKLKLANGRVHDE